MDVTADMSARLAELSRGLEQADLNEALRHIAMACATMIPGTSGASVTLWREDGPYTFAASTAAVDAVDTVQYELMSGPCVDATRVHQALIIKDMSRETRWPEFSRAALDCGLHSSLSLPLVVGQKVVGSLNLYGEDPDAFDEQAQELAHLVAAHGGSATLATSVLFDARELAENLRVALVSRRSIDRAIGIVMAKEGLDQDRAFDLLVKASQQANVKLRDLATDMVHKAGQVSRGDRD